MRQPLVFTIIAKDRPGIVRRIADVLREHSGHWNHSSMSRLSGRFAGMLQADVPAAHLEACTAAMESLAEEGLHVVIRRGEPAAEVASGPEYRLELVGNDRPGIVSDISTVLAAHKVNVHGLETLVEGASMAGGELFRAWATLQLPNGMDAQELTAHLEDLANDLMVDIGLEP